MIEVTVIGKSVALNMNGTAYHFPNEHDAARFRSEYVTLWSTTGIADLVFRYLDKMQQVLRKFVSSVVRIARELADRDNYWSGRGAASYAGAARYL